MNQISQEAAAWDLIRGGALDDDDDDAVTHSTQPLLDEERKITLESQIESLSLSLKLGLESNDPHLVTGIEKFLKRYTDLSQNIAFQWTLSICNA